MRIVVRGIPAAQGSKRHVGGGRMVESSRAVGPWREAVRAETQDAMDGLRAGYSGPLIVVIGFHLPRPKSLAKRVVYPSKRPDLDKLARSTLDGLTEGGAWADDSQVVTLTCWKRYADEEHPPGCEITVREVGGGPL